MTRLYFMFHAQATRAACLEEGRSGFRTRPYTSLPNPSQTNLFDSTCSDGRCMFSFKLPSRWMTDDVFTAEQAGVVKGYVLNRGPCFGLYQI